ncbi:MAG: mechanosensitive ion channel family protein [Myxococcota bacterium]
MTDVLRAAETAAEPAPAPFSPVSEFAVDPAPFTPTLDPVEHISRFKTVTESLIDALSAKLLGWLTTFIVMLPNLVVAALVLVVFSFAARWIGIGTNRLVFRTSRNRPISDLLASITRVGVTLIGLFVALGLLHLDQAVTSLIAGLGVFGLVAGFAFQDIASNFMAGIIMALNRPFDVDDLVEVAGQTGTVLKIEMRATMIRTLDGLVVTLPNKDVFQGAIINYTSTPERRMDLAVGVAYDSDLAAVRELVIEVAEQTLNRDRRREPEVLFEQFGESSIDLTVRVWLNRGDQLAWLRSRSDLMIRLKAAFDEHDVTIPFPIRTLDFGADAVGGVPFGTTDRDPT